MAWRITSFFLCQLAGAMLGWSVAGTRGAWVIMLFVGFGVAMWEVFKLSKQSPKG